MKYCKYCGAELADDAVACNKCGRSLEIVSSSGVDRSQNKLGVAGFVLSFFFIQPLALIFSIIGLVVGKKHNDKVGLAIAGLVMGVISIVILVIIYYSVYLPLIDELMRQYGLVTALAIL